MLFPRWIASLAAALVALGAAGCAKHAEPRFTVIFQVDATSRGQAPDRAAILGRSGFERRHTLRPSQADVLVKVVERGGQLRGFEMNLFLGDFGEPALMQAIQQGPLRIRVDDRLLDSAKAGTVAGAEVRLRIGPDSHFETLDLDLPAGR